jgi:predicted nucleic acid-binding protein
MTGWFADTFFFLALANESDEAHERAVKVVEDLRTPIVTTAWVLTEIADALAAPATRGTFGKLVDLLRDNALVTIEPPDEALFQDGVRLYLSRPDKAWSLTDCISFVVMERRGLSEALTGDHHFEQAGFKALLE